MKKTLRSVLALFLVVAMLFGISASTVAFALEPVLSNSDENSGQTPSNQPGSVDSSDTDWCVIEYDDEEIKVILNPDKADILDTNKDFVKELFADLVEAVKEVVILDIKNDISDKYFGGELESITDIKLDNIWELVINGYIATLDPAIAESENPYFEYFEALIDPNSGVDIDDFVDHACLLIEAAVNLGLFTVEEFEEKCNADVIEETIDKLLEHEIDSVLSTRVDEYVDIYIDWIKSGYDESQLDLPQAVKEHINEQVIEYLTDIADDFVDGDLDDGALNEAIEDYLEREITKYTKNLIKDYAHSNPHTSGIADADYLINEKLIALSKDNLEHYIRYRFGHVSDQPIFYVQVHAHANSIISSSVADETAFRAELDAYGYDKAVGEIGEKILAEYDSSNTWKFTDMIERVVHDVIHSDRYHDELENKVNEILNQGNAIEVFHYAYDDLDAYAQEKVMEDIVNKVHEATVFDFYNPNEFSDKVFDILLNMTHLEFRDTLDGFEKDIVDGFEFTMNELDTQTQEERLMAVIGYVYSVSIGGIEIFGEVYDKYGSSYMLKVEAIRELIHTLPTPQEIAELSPAEMVWSYDFIVDTEFTYCDFTVTVEIADNHELVTKLAQKVSEYLFYYYSDDDVYVVDVTVPEVFSKLLLKACESGRISDELKEKIFTALDMNSDELSVLYSEELTFADIIEILENLDIDGLLDKEFIASRIDTSKLSEEQILEKIKEYEAKYTKIFEKGKKIFNKIPAKYQNKTLMDFYDADKQVFHIADGYTLNFADLVEQYGDKLPGKIADYPNLLLTYIDSEDLKLAFDLTFDFEKINRVEYVADGESVRVGMLPVGADVAFFAGIDKIGNKEILAWVDEDGNVVETMPDRDVVLTAVVDVDFLVSVSDDIDKVYDTNTEVVSVKVTGSSTAKFTYQWYKDGTPIANSNYSSFTVKNVADSGEYYCVIDVVDGIIEKTLTSAVITVNIEKAVVDASSVSWDYTGAFTYDKQPHKVSLVGLPAGVSVTYANNVKTEANSYTATVTTVSVDANVFDTANYTLDEAAIKALSLNWKINPKGVSVAGLTWTISGPQEYTGNVYEPKVVSIPEGVKILSYSGTVSAINVGDYTTYANFAPINSNYTIDGTAQIYTRWSITDSYVYVDVSALSWRYDGATPYVYDGNPKTVSIRGYNASQVRPVYANASAVDADTYTATATFEAVDGESFVKLINGTAVPSFTWTIDQKGIDLSVIRWDYTAPFTYNFGEVFSVDIVASTVPAGVVVELDDTSVYSASAIGTYVAKATAELESGYIKNYKLVNSIAPCNWEIEKIKVVVDASDFWWDYDSQHPYVYNGKMQTVTLMGTRPEGVKVSYSGTKLAVQAGEYTTYASLVSEDSDIYEVEVVGTVAPCTWKINKVKIDLSAYDWSASLMPYTGTVQTVTVVGLPETVVLEYTGNTGIEVGDYVANATATLTDTNNYYLDGAIKEHKWSITNQVITIDPEVTVWDYNGPITYCGDDITVSLKNLPAGVKPVYSGNVAINVGTYTASVTFEAEDNNVLVVGEIADLTWEIIPRSINLYDYDWSEGIFDYDGKEHTVTLVDLPKGLEVEYVGNTAIAGGKYTATATVVPSDNFFVYGEFKPFEWEIRRSTIDLSDVYWDYTEPFVFDDTNHEVVLAGIPDFVPKDIFKYTGNVNYRVGVYTASVSLIDDIAAKYPEFYASCEILDFNVPDLTWEIIKADVNLDGISFNDASYAYDGKVHDLVVTGTLPDYLGVRYSHTGLFLMGEYEVTAYFYVKDDYKESYNDTDATMTATLTIISYTVPEHFYPYEEDFIVSVKPEKPITGDHEFIVNDVAHISDGYYLDSETYGRVITSYDISFYRGGAYMPQSGNFIVKIYVPEEYRTGYDLRVIYVAENGDIEQLEGEIVGDYMVFNTTHFSTYAVVNVEDAPVDPERPDYTWLWILLIILAILIIAFIIFWIIWKKFKKNDDGDTPDGDDDEKKAAAEKAAAEKAAAEKAAAEKAAAEKAAAEKAAAEKAAAEKAAAEKAAAEKAAAEKAAAEKAAAEKAAPEVVVVLGQNPDEEDGSQGTIVDGEVVYVRYRSSFESRLIQAETDIQDYYTVIKNSLLSYKGVKARTSWNYESFNKGRVSCAKVNIKGRTLVIYLNLNPAEYNVNKYHFVDMSDNPKFDQTPMLMKIRSDRALKYTVELIEEMMRVLEIPALETPANEDYHMPYETTEALAKRGLVKVILPPGMTLDENANIVKANVGDIIDKNETVSIENTPLAALKPEITEAVHVDAVHADQLITDDEAKSVIEVIHTGASQRVGKLAEINLDTICENFENGEIVNLESLKAKRLVSKDTARVKVLARGTMLKALTVVASKFSLQAVKMIILAGGVAEIED